MKFKKPTRAVRPNHKVHRWSAAWPRAAASRACSTRGLMTVQADPCQVLGCNTNTSPSSELLPQIPGLRALS